MTDARSGDVDAGVRSEMSGYQCRIAVDDSVFRRLDFVEISHHFGGKGVGTGLFGGAVEVETRIHTVAFRLFVVAYGIKADFCSIVTVTNVTWNGGGNREMSIFDASRPHEIHDARAW